MGDISDVLNAPRVRRAPAESIPACPNCGKPMEKRVNRKTDLPFWGCTKFPACRGYRPYQAESRARGKLIENPSAYQRDVFDWIAQGKGNAVVEAVAGSGKTSTMVHAASLFPPGARSVFLAFNKHIADELGSKLPPHVLCGTMHSICLRAIQAQGRVQIDASKTAKIVRADLRQSMSRADLAVQGMVAKGLLKMVSLAKSTLIDPKSPGEVRKLVDDYGITFRTPEQSDAAMKRLPYVMRACLETRVTVDFDDMIWFIYAHNLPVQQYDWVVVDEAQDLNNLQMEILRRMIAPGGRCIAVGDRAQSIYGFRGANTSAISLLIQKLAAKVLPLNVCYRCPRSHIGLAQKLVSQIEAADAAVEGTIERYCYSEVKSKLKTGDLVLCRLNAPLAGLCLSLIERGVKATIKGRDIAASLVDIIEATNAHDLVELVEKVERYRQREISKLVEQGQDTAAQSLADRCDVITAVCRKEGVKYASDVIRFIQGLFNDNTEEGVICSSVHKAKGLEAKTVYILYPNLMPSPHAKTAEDMEQEKNIEYVALTRSKDFLGFIEED